MNFVAEGMQDAVIPTRSRKQARDWSLVLISQGIEATILHEEGAWVLLVSPAEHARALDAGGRGPALHHSPGTLGSAVGLPGGDQQAEPTDG